MKFLPDSGGYKSTSRGRELRRIQTHMPQTMGSKQPETWSPRWVRQKHREKNNGLPSNDPNYDEKSPADAERPLYKCDLDCQSHKSLDHDTYGRRYWSCPQSTCMFHWGWDEEKPRKIVSIVTLILHILNLVIINLFLNGVCVTLFPPPSKPSRCDFKQLIDDYMTPKDIEYVAWVKKNRVTMSREGQAASCLVYCTLF
jgi:hypothetical protein